ncbi:hypothetical protein N475_00160 [Pseudoalteromonas luteoviolacea DSM 6061]|uniref:Rubredoxin-like domain-containing protein n=1 Tax=Pseudoalteromonas luteoviolacea DSM 6061 TaxID=1365250 RepID=A0A166YMN3_9GAMM|nr:hypothetical protein N475_00160 [Pseudoalteromonas luteoviolacea DSM 6061]
MWFQFFNYKSKYSSPCERCGVLVSDDQPECPHCKGLSSKNARILKGIRKNEMSNKNKGLSLLMKVLFCLCGLGVVYLFTL